MKLGLLKEVKTGEYRVVLTPNEIKTIVADGHDVLVQQGAGMGAGFKDEAYEKAGAKIVDSAEKLYKTCDMVVKVKEIEEEEFDLLHEDLMVFCCLHPASDPKEVDALLKSKCISITAEDSHRYGSPNCESAGKVGALLAIQQLFRTSGGKGKLVSGLGGAPAARAIVLGGGNVGASATQILHGLGAKVTVFDINIATLRGIESQYHGQVDTMLSTKENIESIIADADILINAVKWPKGRDDFLVEADMLNLMEDGSVLIDISCDENGAIETYRPTTLEDPTFVYNGVIHYCVSNIPSIAAQSTSIAYATSMVNHIRNILNLGLKEAFIRDGYLRRALTTYKGYLTHEETSAIQDRPWIRPEDILGLNEEDLDPAPPATVTRSKNYLKEV